MISTKVKADGQQMLFVMEAFIAANRALLDGVDAAIARVQDLPPHYCRGAECNLHREALAPLSQALDDNTRIGDFITEVLV